MNKRGIIYEEIIFLVLNLVFFAVLLVFISQSSEGKLIYEQAYAKQIALFIDEAKPEMEISLDIGDAIKIAEKNKIDVKEIIKIDNEKKKVEVKLGSVGGYSYAYFSQEVVSSEIKENKIIIKVTK